MVVVYAGCCFYCHQLPSPRPKADRIFRSQQRMVAGLPTLPYSGNLYYVGTYELAAYLITTLKGHILINTGLDDSGPLIRAHVRALGFKFEDIKILLATHAHFDHVGAMAAIKKQTGAQMMINERDAEVLADGGNSDYVLGELEKAYQKSCQHHNH